MKSILIKDTTKEEHEKNVESKMLRVAIKHWKKQGV